MPKRRTGYMGRAYDIDGPDEAVELYRGWADSYDDDVVGTYGYVAPELTVDAFLQHCSDPGARVLDVGCGTGLAGEVLKARGFADVDGLDISPEMLRQAEAKGVYRRLIEADLTAPLDLADDSYDAVISVGTFTHGHVGADGLDELVRIVRPGGPVSFTVNEGVWAGYRFADKLAALDRAGAAGLVDRTRQDYLRETGVQAWVVTLKVA